MLEYYNEDVGKVLSYASRLQRVNGDLIALDSLLGIPELNSL